MRSATTLTIIMSHQSIKSEICRETTAANLDETTPSIIISSWMMIIYADPPVSENARNHVYIHKIATVKISRYYASP